MAHEPGMCLVGVTVKHAAAEFAADPAYRADHVSAVQPGVRMNAGLGEDYSINDYYCAVADIVGYVGGRNIFYLLIGKYHRPVVEKKVFMFLDMKGSTNLVDRLGAIRMKALVGKFLFDVSKPITDNGGEVYRFTGDGFVAMWDWDRAFLSEGVFQAVDGLFSTVAIEKPVYEETFGIVPEFRVGIRCFSNLSGFAGSP